MDIVEVTIDDLLRASEWLPSDSDFGDSDDDDRFMPPPRVIRRRPIFQDPHDLYQYDEDTGMVVRCTVGIRLIPPGGLVDFYAAPAA